jgi:hypothetical protein
MRRRSVGGTLPKKSFLRGLLRCCCGPLSLSLLMLGVVVGCHSSPLATYLFFQRCCGMSFFPSRHLSSTPLVHLFLDVVVGCCSSPLVIRRLCLTLLWAVVRPLSSLSVLLLFTASFLFFFDSIHAPPHSMHTPDHWFPLPPLSVHWPSFPCSATLDSLDQYPPSHLPPGFYVSTGLWFLQFMLRGSTYHYSSSSSHSTLFYHSLQCPFSLFLPI